MMPQVTLGQFLSDIETIYQRALDDGKWVIALQAKELQGKAMGLFKSSRLPEVLRISDMTEGQLEEFIFRLEKNSGLLPYPDGKDASKISE